MDNYDEVLPAVTKASDSAVAMDANDSDPEVAHGNQDSAAHAALAWIAEYSTDDRAKNLAAIALRPFETEGIRWYA